MLRVAILTTDTPHHRYFLQRFQNDCADVAELVAVVFEMQGYPWRRNARRHFRKHLPNLAESVLRNPYLRPDYMAGEQPKFENAQFAIAGLPTTVAWGGDAITVETANDQRIVDHLGKARPDVLLVYGTGKLVPAIFGLSRLVSINAHGGKLPQYRGLDTNLWAAFEGRPQDMFVTLHEVAEKLDTGRVFLERQVPPDSRLNLATLRYFTTLVCCDLFREVILQLAKGQLLTSTPRNAMSRYYGPMPWIYKRRTDMLLRAWGQSVSNQAKASHDG